MSLSLLHQPMLIIFGLTKAAGKSVTHFCTSAIGGSTDKLPVASVKHVLFLGVSQTTTCFDARQYNHIEMFAAQTALGSADSKLIVANPTKL
jgi:hypothetical protein